MRTACPYCGRELKISNSHQGEMWGAFILAEYDQSCECGFKARYSYGSYEMSQLPYWKQEELDELAMLEGEEDED
jgi:RNase P subunit RPR2